MTEKRSPLSSLSRRQVLGAALATPFSRAWTPRSPSVSAETPAFLDIVKSARGFVVGDQHVIAKQIPGLEYVQIDDGYQPAMGEWLETLDARPDVRDVWTGESLGRQASLDLTRPSHSARLLECTRG